MNEFLKFIVDELLPALAETIEMVGIAGLISTILGILLGVILFVFNPQRGLVKNKYFYNIFSFLINCLRSIPFLILGVLLIPFTKALVGRFTGPHASIVPLTIASSAFIGKMVENSFIEVNEDIIEAGKSLGMSKIQIINKILIKEALPSICNGICVALVSLLGISAVVEAWGGGGLGALAKILGITQNRFLEMGFIVVIIIILVELINMVGNMLYKKLMYGKKVSGVKKGLLAFLCVLLIVPFFSLIDFNKDKEVKTITMGTMDIPGKPICEFIKDDFEAKGYNLVIETFGEFSIGNRALREGDYDVNLFQHTPYLNSQNEDGALAVACEMYYPVFGGYSKTITLNEGESLKDKLKDGAEIHVPNDDANRTRALNILKKEKIITFTDAPVVLLKDVIYLKKVKIVEMASDFITKSVIAKDCDLGFVSVSFAVPAKLTTDGGATRLVTEDESLQSRNVNIVAIRSEDKEEQWIKDLVEVLTSQKTTDYINKEYAGTLIARPESKLSE